MSYFVPVPAEIRVADASRPYGKFFIFPIVSERGGEVQIDRWQTRTAQGEDVGLYDVLLLRMLPRSLLCHICRETFEKEECPFVTVNFHIDDQKWSYSMRAIEREYEQVHYEIEIDDEWMSLTDVFVGDIIGEEQFPFAEREVLPSISFADPEALYNEMS